jgi:hypothetical protein
MKKVFIALVAVVAAAQFSFADPGPSDKNYATTGIWEIGGSFHLVGTRIFVNDSWRDDYSVINFSIAPMVNYFIINGFHIGFGPNLTINSYMYDSDDINTYIYIGPTIAPGYCFRLSDSLFLDLSPSYTFISAATGPLTQTLPPTMNGITWPSA